jgi:uncharacterized repeat protein (TIGR02543 family)
MLCGYAAVGKYKRRNGMKTWKQGFIGVLVVFALALAFIACGDDKGGDEPVLCTCDPKEHLGIGETCTCGGTDCTNCTLQIYGTVGGVNIYRKGAVENMADAVAKVENAYNGTSFDDYRADFPNKIGKIIIISSEGYWSAYAENGKWTVELEENVPSFSRIRYTMNTPVSALGIYNVLYDVDDDVSWDGRFTGKGVDIVTHGNTVNRPTPDPTKAGYLLEHWYNATTNTEWDFNTPITANITLKAKWIAE